MLSGEERVILWSAINVNGATALLMLRLEESELGAHASFGLSS